MVCVGLRWVVWVVCFGLVGCSLGRFLFVSVWGGVFVDFFLILFGEA